MFEAQSKACPSVASFLSIHNMCAAMLDRFGSDDLKSRILEPAVRLETVLSYGLTETERDAALTALFSDLAQTLNTQIRTAIGNASANQNTRSP